MCKVILPKLVDYLNKEVYSLTNEEREELAIQILDQIWDSIPEDGTHDSEVLSSSLEKSMDLIRNKT